MATIDRVDREFHNRQRGTGFGWVVASENRRELLPDSGFGGLPFNYLVIDGPRLFPAPPRYDFEFDAILLNVHAGRQDGSAPVF